MVLCRNCAHTTRLTMVNCPRCGYTLPYWRSRRWGIKLPSLGLVVGRQCPRCGRESTRQRTPLLLKPLRLLGGDRCSYRKCTCGWAGLAFHAPTTRRLRA